MAQLYIRDPLTAVHAGSVLFSQLARLGYEVTINSDISLFEHTKRLARDEAPTPYFDSEVSGLNSDRFFWMKITSPELPIAGLQAFRMDQVETSLADWAPSYTIGVYMQRGEMLVPDKRNRIRNSAANQIKGRLVYNGELWLAPRVKNRAVYEAFSKLGLILSLIKWNPDSVWALAERTMATHGHPIRGGYSVIESGFFRWEWTATNLAKVEWLHLATRQALEQIVDDVMLELQTPKLGDSTKP